MDHAARTMIPDDALLDRTIDVFLPDDELIVREATRVPLESDRDLSVVGVPRECTEVMASATCTGA